MVTTPDTAGGLTTFSPQALRELLAAWPTPPRYRVAYSGGPDSHALLHAAVAAALPAVVSAVHVDHRLQPDSAAWAAHCRQQCRLLGVEIEVCTLEDSHHRGRGPEAAARERRYQVLEQLLQPGEFVLTGHTLDDQAETVLLQCMRGAGPAGLAAMPVIAELGAGRLLRPLLGFQRHDVLDYVHRQALDVLTDPSNSDTGLDRNFLRADIVPRLADRWPAVSRVLSRVATHQAEAAMLLEELAAADLAILSSTPARWLSCAGLMELTRARRHNVVRYWVRVHGHDAPPARVLEQLDTCVIGAQAQRNPMLSWGQVTLRRYRGRLYLVPRLPAVAAVDRYWQLPAAMDLEHGVLTATTVHGSGLAASCCAKQPVKVCFRTGGERCRPVGRRHSQTLKRLFQEAGIEPWRRERIPLLFVGEQLAAVAGLWVCEGFEAEAGQAGWQLHWADKALD